MVRVGLDIGGTKTAVLVVDENMRKLSELTRPTDVSSPEGVVRGAVSAVYDALAAAGATPDELISAGAGVPGLVDPHTGTVRLAVNLGLTEAYPLAHALQQALRAPVSIENDVRTAALGAYRWLYAAGPPGSVAYLSIGTGIAAGIVLNGRLHRGANGLAGEIGHLPVDPDGPRCACGGYGCLEAVASGPAILSSASAAMSGDNGTVPRSTAEVYELAAQGNEAAVKAVRRAGYFIGRAIYLLVLAYDVEKIVLGGGVTGAGQAFRQPVQAALDGLRADSALARTLLPPDKVLMLPRDLNAGALGAVLLAVQQPAIVESLGGQ